MNNPSTNSSLRSLIHKLALIDERIAKLQTQKSMYDACNHSTYFLLHKAAAWNGVAFFSYCSYELIYVISNMNELDTHNISIYIPLAIISIAMVTFLMRHYWSRQKNFTAKKQVEQANYAVLGKLTKYRDELLLDIESFNANDYTSNTSADTETAPNTFSKKSESLKECSRCKVQVSISAIYCHACGHMLDA